MDQVFAVEAGGASQTMAMATNSDPQIISLVRQGITDAFDVLYQRHLKVAQYVARAQTDNPSDADDVVAESFASIFQLLKEGKGPNEFFRAYLLTVVRRTAHDRNRKARRMPTAADDAILDSPVVDNDSVINDLESSIMARAFKSLPERWQAVLWHLDIEGLKPAAAAPLVGLSPNGVSSLAIRAREGLRQAYLQEHISQTVDQSCDEYASQLGKYARAALKRTSQERVRAHLDTCAKCTALLIELNDVQGGMRTILFPLVTGISFSPAVAAALGSAATSAGLSSGAGSTAVSAKILAAGRRGVSNAWKLTAAIVVGAVALVGVLAWVLQSNTGAGSPIAAEPTNAPPVQGASPSTPASEPAAPTSTPQATAVVNPPVTVPPERSALVVGSGSVFSTTAPQATASAVLPTRTVEATFGETMGSGPTERELQVQFSLHGEGDPAGAEADFTLPEQAAFAEGKTVAPAGWICGNVSSSVRHLRCTTDSAVGNDLVFTLRIAVPAEVQSGMFNYQFGGQGLISKAFANSFH